MTLRELIENAHLSALGLLDADDQAKFDAALTHAPATIREQVLAEQARWSSGGVLLPDVEPPAMLRDRVLDAVHASIVDDVLLGSDQGAQLLGTGRTRVHHGWRIASLGMLAGLAVMVGAFGFVYQNNAQIQNQLDGNQAIGSLISKFGPDFDDAIFSAETKYVHLAAGNESFKGRVSLVTNAQWDQARVFFADLPRVDGKSYRLVEVDADGKVMAQLGSFTGGSSIDTERATKPRAGARLALVLAPSNETITGQVLGQDRLLMLATA
jgi:hypothetical protein